MLIQAGACAQACFAGFPAEQSNNHGHFRVLQHYVCANRSEVRKGV